jgi:hypothetical protein
MKNQITVNGKLPRKNMSLINCIKTKQHFIIGLRFCLNLYNLANLNPDSTYQAKFTNNPAKMKENQNGYPQSK